MTPANVHPTYEGGASLTLEGQCSEVDASKHKSVMGWASPTLIVVHPIREGQASPILISVHLTHEGQASLTTASICLTQEGRVFSILNDIRSI